jgi:aspartyl-tRNA(Asn)/glutamyl-tRNA(Gln) amidotransferase subunit C
LSQNCTEPSRLEFFSKKWTWEADGFWVIFVYMEVTDQLVEKLAHLSRLSFNETEKAAIKTDLQSMIAFVEKLKEVDTTGVEPLLHMGDAVNVLRDDEIKGSISRDEALLNAPIKDEQFFKVPKVIKK